MTKTNKVLIMIRTSTEGQSIEDQHNEMLDFVKSKGYNEGDCVWIEEQGASAAKVDDRYKAQIQAIKDAIESNKDINCFACWHLNRAFRTEDAYLDIKNFLVPRKIQFLVKNPNLKLLNEDGSIDNGMELAMGLFAILNKQDGEERKAKFKRAKSAMAKKGMYVGGKNRRYGYKVNENQYFVADENESKIVKLIFQLYSTGQYSAYSLSKELNSRGYNKDGVPFDRRFIAHILRSKQYTGEAVEGQDMVYPPLITKELYEACESIASGNKIALRQGKKLVICSKLIRCPECGTVMSSNSTYFRCNYYIEHKCSNCLTLKETVVNEVAWRVAFKEHIDYLIEVSENNTQIYNERLEVIEQKINNINGIIGESDTKKKRIIDSFIEGYIDKENRDLRLKKIQDDILSHQKEIKALEEERSAISGLLENVNKEVNEMLYYDTLDAVGAEVKTNDDHYRIIHQHILKIVPGRYQNGEKAKGVNRINGVTLDVHTIKGEIKKFRYLPMAKKGDNLFTYNDELDVWFGERF